MSVDATVSEELAADAARQTMEVDIACVGFGPAMGGFLTTLTRAWSEAPDDPAFASRVAPGMPLQVLCYERADDIAAGVSGVVTRAQGIRETFPGTKPGGDPDGRCGHRRAGLYLLDPIGASRRSFALRAADFALRALDLWVVRVDNDAFELPWTPGFLKKHGGLVLSLGQFNQWVGSQVMGSGLVQIWPGTPVSTPIFADNGVSGIRLTDQGVDRAGAPADGFMPGMDVRAPLTVVGDGPVGAVGQAIDKKLGLPPGHAQSDGRWA